MDFGHVYTVALILEIFPWFKVMTHPWIMDIICVKYYLDSTVARSFDPGTSFRCVCTVILIMEIMTHHLVMGSYYCVKYYPDRTREYKVMALTQSEQTDRQTGQFLFTPNLRLWGYNMTF